MNNPYNHDDCDSDFGGCGDKCKRGAYENGYTDGRKAAENYTEKMLVIAKDEVRKCHEEIRRLEDKYARNVFKMPSDGGFHWTPTTNVQFEKLTKDFDELFEMANALQEHCVDVVPWNAFDTWKKARGIE